MKIIIAFLFIAFTSCSSKPKSFDKNDYDKSRQTILFNEQNNPLNFLKIEGDNHKNIFGKTITKSVITNSATICSYKNIRIKMLSFKKRNMVEEHEDVYADELKPNSSADFKTKYHLPKDADSIALSIMSADVVK